MLIEGLMTTCSEKGDVNVAPMGPIVHGDYERLTLRPFAGSTTFENLCSTRRGVFHVVDRIDVIAESAIRRLKHLPQVFPATKIDGVVLDDCCRWFEFQITECDLADQRSVMRASIVAQGNVRPFFGLNRARHAVLEVAILATRVHLLEQSDVEAQISIHKSAVQKTGGDAERESFAMLEEYISSSYKSPHDPR